MLPSRKPRPGTVSSKVHGTFYELGQYKDAEESGHQNHLGVGKDGVDVVVRAHGGRRPRSIMAEMTARDEQRRLPGQMLRSECRQGESEMLAWWGQ